MKKIFKLIITLQIILLVLFFQNSVYAAIVTQNSLKENMAKYASGEKVITTKLDNGDDVTVGNFDKQNDPITLTMTDKLITLSDSTGKVEINYTIADSKCSFSLTREVNKDSTPDEFYNSLTAPQLLSICFLSITDSYNIDSQKALKYYEEKMPSNTDSLKDVDTTNIDYLKFAKLIVNNKKDVKDDVYNYTTTASEEETAQSYKYTTNLDIFINNIEKINSDNTINNNTININDTNVDNTTIKAKTLPKTGSTVVFLVAIVCGIISLIILFIKNKQYKDIK